jgi:hypothetical protein
VRGEEGSAGAGEEGSKGLASHEGGGFRGAKMTSNVLSELQVRPPFYCARSPDMENPPHRSGILHAGYVHSRHLCTLHLFVDLCTGRVHQWATPWLTPLLHNIHLFTQTISGLS